MKLTEIYPGLVAMDFLDTEENMCFWQVWLWESHEAMQGWVRINRPTQAAYLDGADAMHNGEWFDDDWLGQRIGHLHFVKGNWDEETVAHELMHAFMHYASGMIPDFSRMLYCCGRMEDEERHICYPFGRWFAWLYPWLWKIDPNPRQNKEVPDA